MNSPSENPYGTPRASKVPAEASDVPRHLIYAPIAFGAVVGAVVFAVGYRLWGSRDLIVSGQADLEHEIVAPAFMVLALTAAAVSVVTGLVVMAAWAVSAKISSGRTHLQALIIGAGAAFPVGSMIWMAASIGAFFFACSTVGCALLGGQWAISHYQIRRTEIETAPTTGLTQP